LHIRLDDRGDEGSKFIIEQMGQQRFDQAFMWRRSFPRPDFILKLGYPTSHVFLHQVLLLFGSQVSIFALIIVVSLHIFLSEGCSVFLDIQIVGIDGKIDDLATVALIAFSF
jgi:hypothetical protein